MNELRVFEYESIRVLTTQQLAEAYETESQIITNNFNRNKERYQEGKHFIALTGEEKTDFISKNQNDFSSFTKAKAIYLWTEKGAFFHAKSLNTDKAWEVYDHLVDTYFEVKKPLSQLEILQQSVEILNRHEAEIKQIDTRMDKLEYEIPLYGSEADEMSAHIRRRGVNLLGGKQSEAYNDRKLRDILYRNMYSRLKEEFGVTDDEGRPRSYKAMKRKYIADAHEFIDCYVPPFIIQEQIEEANAQMRLGA